MAKTTLFFSGLLMATGLVGYFFSKSGSMTALIPVCFGLVIGLCGLLALNQGLEKQAIIGAAIVALLGFIGSAMRLPKSYAKLSSAEGGSALAFYSQGAMALFCLILVILCLRWWFGQRG